MEILGKKLDGPLDINSEDLPEVGGVYILVNSEDADFNPLYVGMTSANLKRRLKNIGLGSRIGSLIAAGKADKVYFCEFDPEDKVGLSNFEQLLIEQYEPAYNLAHMRRGVSERLIKNLKEVERNSAKRSAFTALFLAFAFLLSTFSVVRIISNESHVQKSELQGSIVTALRNEADLRTLEHIYSNREKINKDLFQAFKSDSNIYPYNIPFSTILEDIRTSMFMKGGEKLLLKKVDSIIEQHLHTNPFDRLEPIQRDYFENIKIKLDAKYPDVIIEVNKIADELHGKNTLVDKYLKDSSTSFWVSVIALMFSILVSSYQIFNGRASRVQRLFAESLSKVQNDNESKDT